MNDILSNEDRSIPQSLSQAENNAFDINYCSDASSTGLGLEFWQRALHEMGDDFPLLIMGFRWMATIAS